MEGTASVKLFGREPAAVAAFLQAALALLVGLGIFPALTPENAALISVAGAAVFGGYVAYATKQTLIPAVVAAFQALVAVAVGFGLTDLLPDRLDVTQLTGLVTALLVGGLGLWLREKVDPKAGPVAEPQQLEVNYPEYEPVELDPEDYGFDGPDEDEEQYTKYLPDDSTVFSGSDGDTKV